MDAAGTLAVTRGYFASEAEETAARRRGTDEHCVDQLQAWSLREGRLAWTRPAKKHSGDDFIELLFCFMRSDGLLVTRYGDHEDAVAVLDPIENRVVRTVRFPGTWAMDARLVDDATLVAAITGDDPDDLGLVQIDLETGRVSARVPLPKSSHSVCISPRGDLALAMLGDDLVLINSRTDEELGRYSAGAHLRQSILLLEPPDFIRSVVTFKQGKQAI